MNIIKRNGKEVQYDSNKVLNAIIKSNNSVSDANKLTEEKIQKVVDAVQKYAEKMNRALNVEEIQDKIENELMKINAYYVARNYMQYRWKKTLTRKNTTTDMKILSLVDNQNEEVHQENANKNATIISTQRDYIAGEVSRDITERLLLPQDIVDAHKRGIIHFHDSDYFINHSFNCCLINLEDMLQNGTCISKTKIETPHRFSTACNIATQIIAQVSSNQYGGQTVSMAHLAPFIDVSRRAIRKEVTDEFVGAGLLVDNEAIEQIVEQRLMAEIRTGVQTLQFQIITLMTTNGQSPFVTFSLYLNEAKNEQEKKDLALLIEEIFKQRIQGVKNEAGAWVAPSFPKLIYFLQDDNIEPGQPYYYLTRLAAECTAKRMVPDYISEKVMKELKVDDTGVGRAYPSMGCRSFLTPYVDENGKPKYFGRFNQGVVTINLVYLALKAKQDLKEFWKILDEVAELCHRGLQIRHKRLLGITSDVSPIHWQHGALARLKKGEKIDKLLFGGYSTISLGYAGLWETVYALSGKKLTEPEGEKLGAKIMEKLNDYTTKWREAENIAYSLYGTPIESTTYKFAQALQRDFSKIEGVSDKNYITNSYHVHVTEPINAFEKIDIESRLQKLSPGGAISYVEVPAMTHNIEAVLTVMKHIYEKIMYAEINSFSDHCGGCGYTGQIQLVEDENHKLYWKCPNCGNDDKNNMTIIRRVCGYLSSSNDCNQGRLADIHDRVLHL